MLEITTRPLSPAERELLEPQTRVRILGYAAIVLLGCLLGGGFLSALCYSIGQRLGPLEAQIGAGIGFCIAIALSVLAMLAYAASQRQRSEQALADLKHNQVEELLVVEAGSVEIGMAAMDEPAIVFQLGDNQLLLLQGSWLLDRETYEPNATWDPTEAQHDFFNGLQAPYSFPSTLFTVIRLPLSQQVIGIRVAGEYQAPVSDNVKYAAKHCAELRQCEILAGTLETLEQSLTAAYQAAQSS